MEIINLCTYQIIFFCFRYIASGLIILGAGSFMFSIPHFLSSKLPLSSGIHHEGTTDAEERNLCHDGQQSTNESDDSEMHSSLAYYRCWFIFGQILHGIGAAPILTLGNYSTLQIFILFT